MFGVVGMVDDIFSLIDDGGQLFFGQCLMMQYCVQMFWYEIDVEVVDDLIVFVENWYVYGDDWLFGYGVGKQVGQDGFFGMENVIQLFWCF